MVLTFPLQISKAHKLFWQGIASVIIVSVLLTLPVGFAADLKGNIEYTQSSYRVGPGDVLSIQVYHQPDNSQPDVLIRDDGYATINGIGEVLVAGKTVSEITQDLTPRISELIVDPLITVTVTQMKQTTVYLSGAVKQPGMFQLGHVAMKSTEEGQITSRTDTRLTNVLSTAGGLQMNADLSDVQVHQSNTDNVVHVNLWQMLKYGDPNQNIRVQSGDSIFVPTLKTALNEDDYKLLLRSNIGPQTIPVRVIGEVKMPGVVEINGKSPFLNTAIATAGGFEPGANRNVVAIRRFSGGTAQTIFVNPNKVDNLLLPNDVVFIAENKLYKSGRYLETVSRIFSPFTALTTSIFNLSVIGSIK